MRYRIEMVIDIPQLEDQDVSEGEIRQIIWDNVIHVPLISHLEDAVHWCGRAMIGEPEEGSTPELVRNKAIFDVHNNWADILKGMKFHIVRVPDSYQTPSLDTYRNSISFPLTSWDQLKLDPMMEDYPIVGIA